MDDIKERQLNAIVGAAIRGLAESGASNESIGAFSSTYRGEVEKILGIEARAALDPPDLMVIIQTAVAHALADAQKPIRPSRAQNDRFTVYIGGARTSVTIQKALVEQIHSVKGSRKAVTQFVREVALTAPAECENRSAWIEERIAAVLVFEKNQTIGSATPASRH